MMRRREFVSAVSATAAGASLGSYLYTADAEAQAQSNTIGPILFDSTCSLLNENKKPLTDNTIVAVQAAQTAFNDDDDGNNDAVLYPDNTEIPLVAVDDNISQSGAVVGVGTPLVPNDVDFGFGQDEFYINVWDALVGSGTVLWDAGHGQFYQLNSDANGGRGPGFEKFEAYAENNGFTVKSTTNLSNDLPGADAIVITSPSDSFTSQELSEISTFVGNGGVVFLHNQSDFRNFDQTRNLNDIATELNAEFRFNDDQVFDNTNNAGSNFLPVTTKFNKNRFGSFFTARSGVDEAQALDPEKTYTTDVVSVSDGDTFQVQFDDGTVEEIRVLGVDTPESTTAADAERPAEWEGLSDRVALTELRFSSACSLLNADGKPLTDRSVVPVFAEPEAFTTDSDNNSDAIPYPEATDIPLVAVDNSSVGTIVGLGAPLVNNDSIQFSTELGNEEFYLNLLERYAGPTAAVRWDESHDQFYDTGAASTFISYAEREGFSVQAGNSIPSDTSSVDALVVTSPSKSFSNAELANITAFVEDGGTVLLHDQDDFSNFDATDNANEVAGALNANFRFNDDQVQDDTNNTGRSFRPTTGHFNGDDFDLFRPRDDIEGDLELPATGDPVDEFGIGGGCSSLLNASKKPLDDDTIVAVRAEPTANIQDSDNNGDAVSYPDNIDIPLVAVEGTVAGLPAPWVNDDELSFNGEFDNEEFYLNLWKSLIGGSGTVRWDESHGQFYDTGKFQTFISYAENNGYTVEAGNSIPSDTSSVDALVVTTPSEAFSAAEENALSNFVDAGGAVLLHDQSDFNNFDETANLNALAAKLGVGFRFNDAQVVDDTNNLGEPFRPTTSNINTSSFGPLFVRRPGVDDTGKEFFDETYPYLSYHSALATDFAKKELAGKTVDISFDPIAAKFNGGVKDPFGRLLAYVRYDDGSGNRTTLYNRRLIDEGFARVYNSSFSRQDEFQSVESDARTQKASVWSKSNPRVTPTVRNRPVKQLFIPKAEAVAATGRSRGRSNTYFPVLSEQSASRQRPLVGVDRDANIAAVGGLIINETYEKAEGFPVDTAGFENFVFLTNLIDSLGNVIEQAGPVLVEGGHGQFNVDYGLSAEDVAYYQRFLEGVDIGLKGINDITGTTGVRLSESRAIIITPGLAEYTSEEKAALRRFTNNGGVVVLMAGAATSPAARTEINALATDLGTDLRFSGRAVTDTKSNVNNNPTIPVTGNFDTGVSDIFGQYEQDRLFGLSGIRALGRRLRPSDPDQDGLYENLTDTGRQTETVGARDQQALSRILSAHKRAKRLGLAPGETNGHVQRLTEEQKQAFDFNNDGMFDIRDVSAFGRQIRRGN